MAEAADRLADRGAARAWVSAFARSPAVALVADAAGAILALSRPFAGLDPDGLEGAAVGSLAVSPREALVAAHREAATSGAAAKIEVSTDDGEAFDVAVSPIADGDARLVLLVAADVTPRVRAERRLRDSHALLVDTQGTAHLGTWEWYVDEPTATWSDELYRIYGLSPETYTPSYEAYLEFVHPDDRAHVAAATNRVFHEHLPYSHDERIVRRDGSMRYLHTWAHAIVDEDGKLR
ncbi:MAG TPA: PAS domain-containing protein, partial [Minicystis sp.]|nr:PAS domain-containing protein [Minicystis sp.]